MILLPLDIAVIDGLWYMPHHPPIMWRGLDRGVHCLTIATPQGDGWSPEFAGIEIRNLDEYRGRTISIHRYKGEFDRRRLLDWCFRTVQASQGYDYRQWLMGFILGIIRPQWSDNSRHWTCAELPYWAFQDNGYPITGQDEVLPMPRLFRYSTEFKTVFKGVWNGR